jgi:ubiquitin-conjugating enzyme E2 Z
MDNVAIVSKETFKRIVKDVKDLTKEPLTEQNIFYQHDENSILKGYAMIIGPKDTCYHNGFFFFEFNFPYNYPWAPPKVLYNTNDGTTRFNPNLYRDGKVCLSVLNTWKGEPWSACQTIKSILLILQTVLNNEPLLNEPGVSKEHLDFNSYNEFIKFKTYEYALFYQYLKDNNQFEIFRNDMKNYVVKNKSNIIEELKLLNTDIKKKYDTYNPVIKVRIYCLDTVINYETLIQKEKYLI